MGILSDPGLKCSTSGKNSKAAAESLRPELPKKALALLLKAKVAVFLDSPSSSQGGEGGEGGALFKKVLLGSLQQRSEANFDNMLKTSLFTMFWPHLALL